MGNHDHGHALARQVAHNAEDVAHELGVEGARSLVKQHHVRVHRQRSRDGNALLLAAGELAGHVVHALAHAHLVELGERDFLCLLGGALEDLLLGDHDVLLHAEVREEVELLEHHAKLGAHGVDVLALGADVGALEDDLAARGGLEQVHAAQHRGLAGAGRAQHHHDLALVNIEVDAAQHHRLVVVGLVEVLDLNDDLAVGLGRHGSLGGVAHVLDLLRLVGICHRFLPKQGGRRR